jgi:hypothetical protein
LGAYGHAVVVRDEPVELVTNLECGGEMQCIKRAQCHGLEQRCSRTDRLCRFDNGDLRDDSLRLCGQLGCRTADCAHDLDLEDGAGKLIRIALEQVAQRDTLRVLDDKLYERRRVDVDQI